MMDSLYHSESYIIHIKDSEKMQMKPKYTRYCESCKGWFDADDLEFRDCPICGASVRMIKCNRCEYEWKPRRGNYPTICTNRSCRSKYYNIKRTLEKITKCPKCHHEWNEYENENEK